MANEFFSTFSGDVAISLTPGANGRFEVYLDGEKIFDRMQEEGKPMPDLIRVRKWKQVVQANTVQTPGTGELLRASIVVDMTGVLSPCPGPTPVL